VWKRGGGRSLLHSKPRGERKGSPLFGEERSWRATEKKKGKTASLKGKGEKKLESLSKEGRRSGTKA